MCPVVQKSNCGTPPWSIGNCVASSSVLIKIAFYFCVPLFYNVVVAAKLSALQHLLSIASLTFVQLHDSNAYVSLASLAQKAGFKYVIT